MLVVNALVPVILLIGLGAWLQGSGRVSAVFMREANRVTYLVGLPALLFSQIVHALRDAAGAERMLAAMLLASVLALLLAYPCARLLRIPTAATGTFVHGAFRGNLAFVGLPIIFALPDAPVLGGLSSHSAAVLVVAPTMVFYNVVGVLVLTASQHRLGWAMVWPVVRQLAVTPPLLATLGGIAWVALGWELPRSADRALTALGEMALPLGLLGVGGALVTAKVRGALGPPFGSALVKGWLTPLLGWGTCVLLGLGPRETVLVMILAAAPTAIVSYTMAHEMKGDAELASTTIALSVFTSLTSLAVIVAFYR